MFKMLKKFFRYFKACHRGEILKKIEYKIKDNIGYFYIRNKLQNQNKNIYINECKIDIPKVLQTTEEQYEVFGKKIYDNDIINFLVTDRKFWRKVKLNQYEDVKIVWEYNRLQFLLPMAIKYKKTQNNEYKNKIIEILDFWEKENEFEYTVNWNSNLEVAIRAINITLALLIMQSEQLTQKYSKLLYLHAKHIYSEIAYSDICIPNNHVIGEATALLILSKILNVEEGKKWGKKAKKILYKYTNIIDEDGVSKENSFGYQYFVTKMYILNLCFIEEKDLFAKINQKIIKSLNFLKWTIINENEILNYGDNDDGFVFSIYNKFNIAKDIEEYYNLFCNNITYKESKLYRQIFNKFNPQNEIKIEETNEEKEFILTRNIFIYKWNNNILFFNAKDIEGHAHNDSLAINLIIEGKEVLLDAGTYSYNKSKEDRRFFRGREAHNTIQLEDNAEQIGSFRWINKNKSYISSFKKHNDKLEVEGTIENLASRKIVIDKKNNKIEVIDKQLNKNKILLTWLINDNSSTKKNEIVNDQITIVTNEDSNINSKEIYISNKYLRKTKAIAYFIENNKNNTIQTTISIKEKI